MLREIRCPTCKGYGFTQSLPCPDCEGKGRITESDGIDSETDLSLWGIAPMGYCGGPNK